MKLSAWGVTILLLPLCGCNNLPKAIAAASKDTNSVEIRISTPWGTGLYRRNLPPAP